MSATPDSKLANPEHRIADLKRQLAESTAERDEAQAQQAATAEVLGVINSSPGDLAPVFEAILEKAMALCEAEFGILNTHDRENFHRASARGVPPAFEEWRLRQGPMPSGPRTLYGRITSGEKNVLHTLDLMAEDSYRDGDPDRRAFVELAGARTALVVALRKEETLLGTITIFRQEVRPFSDKQIALLQNFAAQAVIAIENARLITETREALEQQTATAEVLGVINSSPGELAPVFDAILEKALRLCSAAHGSLFTLVDDTLHQVASVDATPQLVALRQQQGPNRIEPGTAFYPLLEGQGIVHLADVRESAAYRDFPAIRERLDAANARSLLAVALRKDEALLGVLDVYRQEVHPFTDKQIALLQNFAAQAVIAMENARLLTETREALEQQTATAEVLGVINSSPGDLAPVFDAILEKAHSLCGATFGGLLIYDGDRFKAVALHNVPPAFAEIAKGFLATPHHPIARLLEGEPLVHIADLKEIAEVAPTGSLSRAGVDLAGIRTLLLVPLRKGDALLGVITAYRQEVCPFSDKQIALLQNFAAQAVIAIENARLITETREALEQQTATAEVLQVINASPGDLAPVFDAMLQKALNLCGADLGGLYRFDGKAIHPVAMQGGPKSAAELLQQSFVIEPGSSVERLIRGEVEVVQVPDIVDTEAYRSGSAYRVKFIELTGARTALWVALRQDEALVGVFVIYRQEVRPFSDKQIALLQNFAAQAVIAMENARLITETREALEQQTATSEVLQVINSSPGDLTPVFDAMLEKALHLCEAAFGNLCGFDGATFPVLAAHGLSLTTHRTLKPDPGSALECMMRGDDVVHIPDVVDTEAYRAGMPGRVGLVQNTGARTALWVALRKDQALRGIFVIYRREVRPFSDKQIALLQNFAAQAVIAMENARLLGELRQRTDDLTESLEYQTATSDVLKVISRSTFDLEPIFKTIVATAVRLCDADTANIGNREGDGVRIAATFAASTEFNAFIQGRLLKADHGSVFGRTLLSGQVVHVPDIASDPEYNIPEAITLGKNRTTLGVPLLRDGAVIGVIALARGRVQPFTDRQIELVRTFADQAVIAMENARLLGELRQRTDEVGELNRGLEARVAEQVDELGRVGRLKRFLAPQLAELIVSQGDEKILESHRREIVVVFCDLRGYTAFTETAEPEEVLDFLRQYHGALGPLVSQYEGTLDQFSGDGIMVFFNDPVPCPDPAERAVKMAMAMREVARELISAWSRHGCELGFGIGIAQGYATLGQIGFSERSGYTAIGTVCNLAARLCAEAQDGQILVSSRVAGAVGALARLEDLGNLELKGLRRPVAAFNVAQSTSPAEARPNLTVVSSAPGA